MCFFGYLRGLSSDLLKGRGTMRAQVSRVWFGEVVLAGGELGFGRFCWGRGDFHCRSGRGRGVGGGEEEVDSRVVLFYVRNDTLCIEAI